MAEFAIVPAAAIDDPDITDNQLRWLARLATYADKNGYCFPSLNKMAEKYNVSKSAVSKAFRNLADIGWLEIVSRYREDGSQCSNAYYIFRHKHNVRPEVEAPEQDTEEEQPVDGGLTSRGPQGVHLQGSMGGTPPEVDPLTDHINRPKEYISTDPPLTKNPTEEERKVLKQLKSIEKYPFRYERDLSMIREYSIDYPFVDLLDEVKRWRIWLSENKVSKKTNYRLRFRNWCENAQEWAKERGSSKNGKVDDVPDLTYMLEDRQ